MINQGNWIGKGMRGREPSLSTEAGVRGWRTGISGFFEERAGTFG